jgi:predicted DNA-binding transcriptional regulator YafY
VQRQRVCESFGIVPAQVTRDIGIYLDRCPGNLTYDNRRKLYLAGNAFKPALASGDANEHLALLRAGARPKTVEVLPTLGTGKVSHAVLPQPAARVLPEVLRATLHAIRNERGLGIDYLSMGTGTGKRSVWPHGLLYAGSWWYLRAFDAMRKGFRDFALHRIDAAELIDEPAPMNASQDREWSNSVDVIMMPDPRLTEYQQRIVARDFDMSNDGSGWVWHTRMRLSLIGYFAAAYWLDTTSNRPRRTRVVLRNRDELTPYFFKQTASE